MKENMELNPIGKYSLELNSLSDGRMFLNYWDWYQGLDVCAEIKEGVLFIDDKEVSFPDYLNLVLETLKQQL